MSYRALLRTSWANRKRPLARRRGGRAALGVGSEINPRAASTQRGHRVGPAQRLRRRLLTRLLQEIESAGPSAAERPEIRQQVRDLIDEELGRDDAPTLSLAEQRMVERSLIADLSGFGPIDPLFRDPTVSDILINGPYEVWVDRFGRIEPTQVRFDNEEHLMRLLSRMVSSHGRHLDEASPSVDVRLSDRSRLHAVIPPLSSQPTVSIRRARRVPFRIEELYACGTLSPEMGEFLKAAVRGKLNLCISGGAASGKTTLLNVLSTFIPLGERVITIEQTAELMLDHPHVVTLEERLPNIEGRGAVSLRALVQNSLRMRADRIIVGEVRGPEVFDMLQAMNVGHEGSLTTVHANSPEDALRRLENLVLMGGYELPSRAIRELLGAALQILVHISRLADGSRRITSIREVRYVDETLTTTELFRLAEPAVAKSAGDQNENPAPSSSPAKLVVSSTPSFLDRLRRVGYDGGEFDPAP